MSEKKKSASQSEMAEPKARAGEREREPKSAKATARERETRESKPVRRESKPAARGQSRWRNRALVRFVREAYQELRYKVTWPTFQEARNMTIAVVALSAAAGVVLGLADAGLFQLFRLITGK
jgi:preprotein translocase SecE subunit